MDSSRTAQGHRQLLVALLSFGILWISAAMRNGTSMLTIQVALTHCLIAGICLVLYFFIFKTTRLQIRQKLKLRWSIILSAILVLFIYAAFNGIYTHLSVAIKSSNFLVILLTAISSALLEEFLFRGMFFGALLNLLSKSHFTLTYSGIISSFLFGFWHLSNFFWGGHH